MYYATKRKMVPHVFLLMENTAKYVCSTLVVDLSLVMHKAKRIIFLLKAALRVLNTIVLQFTTVRFYIAKHV